MCELDNLDVKALVESVIDEMIQVGGIVFADVANNARNVQLALKKLTIQQNGIFKYDALLTSFT